MMFLRERVNMLAGIIESSGLGDRYLDYVDLIAKEEIPAESVDELEWESFLTVEKEQKLFAHYHTMRSELLEMRRRADAPSFMDRAETWLESPWVRSAITVGTLTHAAMLLTQLLHHTGLFLSDSEQFPSPLPDPSTDQK
jgi:hypothetical protein